MEYIIPALFGLIGVVAGAVITGAYQRRKVKADVTKTEAEANELIRQTVMSLIAPLQKRVDELERELADMRDWADRLVAQVKSLGHDPVPFKCTRKD